jgi:NADP-dependent 3-hydroxy acid dehydrogenase YdfG
MLLQNKIAIIFAASGAIAGQVARSLSLMGAIVDLSGRNLIIIETLADEIRSADGHGVLYTIWHNTLHKVNTTTGLVDKQYGRLALILCVP